MVVAHAMGETGAMVPVRRGLARVNDIGTGRGPGRGLHWQLPGSGYPRWSVALGP